MHPKDPLLSNLQRMQQAANLGPLWEQSRALFLLKSLGLTNWKAELQQQDSNNLLLFSAINNTLGLPLFFATEPCTNKLPLHRDVKSAHPQWFKNFQKIPVMVIYFEEMERYNLRQDDRPFALVFPRKGFEQGLCVHNGSSISYTLDGEGYHCYRSKKHGQDIIVQPFRSVLKAIMQSQGDADEWRATGSK
jgi:hypothetical protein